MLLYSTNINYENIMIVDWPNKRLKLHITITKFFGGVLSAILAASFISLNGFTSTIMATESIQSMDELEENVVHIVKDSMTNYSLINNGTIFVDGFNTNYSIIGNSKSLLGSHDGIISIIQTDFNSSPTIGYVKAGNISDSSTIESPASGDMTLPNPFADSALINQTISQKISQAIESVEELDDPMIDIKCDFDSNIKNWKCMN